MESHLQRLQPGGGLTKLGAALKGIEGHVWARDHKLHFGSSLGLESHLQRLQPGGGLTKLGAALKGV